MSFHGRYSTEAKGEDFMNKKLFSVALALILGAVIALQAFGQAKPEVLVRQRQAAMTLMGKYFGPLAAMAQGRVPYESNVVARNAGYLDALSKMPWDGFDPITKNQKAGALPAVFTETAKFKEIQDRLKS
jgi:cytochrome c556